MVLITFQTSCLYASGVMEACGFYIDVEQGSFLWGANTQTRLRINTFETSEFLEQCWPILANLAHKQFEARAVSRAITN